MTFLSIDQQIANFAWQVVEEAEKKDCLSLLHARCRSFGTDLRIQHLARALAQLHSESGKAPSLIFEAINDWRIYLNLKREVVDLLKFVHQAPLSEYFELMETSLLLIETLKQYSARPSAAGGRDSDLESNEDKHVNE